MLFSALSLYTLAVQCCRTRNFVCDANNKIITCALKWPFGIDCALTHSFNEIYSVNNEHSGKCVSLRLNLCTKNAVRWKTYLWKERNDIRTTTVCLYAWLQTGVCVCVELEYGCYRCFHNTITKCCRFYYIIILIESPFFPLSLFHCCICRGIIVLFLACSWQADTLSYCSVLFVCCKILRFLSG